MIEWLQIIGGLCVGFILVMFLGWLQWKSEGGLGITKEARAICKAAFGDDLPKGWSVVVVDAGDQKTALEKRGGGGNVLGSCTPGSKLIEIFRDRHSNCSACWLDTLVHECLHALKPHLRHENIREQVAFNMIVKSGVRNFWEEARKCDAGVATKKRTPLITPAPGAGLMEHAKPQT